MKKYILLITAIICFTSLFGQKAQIKAGYDYEVSLAGQTHKADYILLSGLEKSIFYNPTALWMDINSKDDAACQAYGAMATKLQEAGRGNEVPNRTESMYIFKNFDKADKTVYDDYSDQFAVFHEPFSEMHWEIVSDSTKTVLGYECVMARSSYHGRNWTAWFTPEIPIPDGPWKFCCLPGLILKATEETGTHSFTVNGIETTKEEIPDMPRDDWYHKEDRIKYLQGKYRHMQDPLADLSIGALSPDAKIFVNGEMTTGEEIRKRARKVLDAGYDFLETDYHR